MQSNPMIDAEIQVAASAWKSLADDPVALARRAIDAVKAAPEGPHEVCIVLGDDADVRSLNQQYRGIDRPTNVLAFPAALPPVPAEMAGEARHLGDVILAFETVKREAEAQNKPFSNHMSHLIVHGTLHLLGYDHESDRDAARMEAEETAILGRLGIPDPYKADLTAEARTAPDG